MRPASRPRYLHATQTDALDNDNGWIATRLVMGHPGSVSRLLGSCRESGELASIFNHLAKALDEASKENQM